MVPSHLGAPRPRSCMRDFGPGQTRPDISWCGECRTLQGARLGSKQNDRCNRTQEEEARHLRSLPLCYGCEGALKPCAFGAPPPPLRGLTAPSHPEITAAKIAEAQKNSPLKPKAS